VNFLFFYTGLPGIPDVFLIAIVLIGPGAIDGVSDALNQLHFDTPAAILVHGVSGVIYFLTMPFQFSPALRIQGAGWHRRAGYLTVASGYVMSISGFWMHHVLMLDGLGARYISLFIISFCICAAFTIALQKVTSGQIRSHQIWVCRAVAITFSVVTSVCLEVPVNLILGQLESIGFSPAQIMHDYGRLLGMAVNLAVVEYVLRLNLSFAGAHSLHEASEA
jgi:uncharacterized membrane protein